MPKRLIRSIIEFDKEVTPENLGRNFSRLRKAVEAEQLLWARPEDESIYRYVLGFHAQHGDVPAEASVIDYFNSTNNLEVIERLKDIALERPYARSNFANLLRNLQEEQIKVKAIQLLRDTAEITTKGVTDQRTGETMKGWEEAYQNFIRKGQALRIDENNVQIHGDIRKDASTIREEYNIAKNNRGNVVGALSGIREIDDACMGAKKGELWIHAAYPGELKTFTAVNWAYNSITRFNTNVVYVSFEMPRDQVRRNVLTLHSSNARFGNQGFKPVDYRHIKYGALTPEEEDFFLNHVVEDFSANPTYCTFEIVTPDREWTMDDVKLQLEMLHKEFEIGLVILDHGQWVEPRKAKRNKDYTISLNSVVRDAKRLALNFNNNEGVPVLMLFQINRNGKTEADKNDGVYKMSALTYANEAEKTADVITTTYLNKDLRERGMTTFSCLKNRDGELFEPFQAQVNFTCRRMLSIPQNGSQNMSVDTADNELSGML